MVAFSQAMKLSDIPFPFPYAQLILWSLASLVIVTPIYVVHFTGGFFLSPWLTFVLLTTFWGLNEMATVLENPFGKRHWDARMAETNLKNQR